MPSEGCSKNWFELNLCLLKVREGLTDFVQEEAEGLHSKIKINVCNIKTTAATTKCTSCTYKDVKKTGKKNNIKWTINCPNGICNLWLDEILAFHKYGPCPKIAWKNTDPKLWQSSPWEVMKIFQPSGCKTHTSPDDADCTGLLSLMLDCEHFHQFVSDVQLLIDVKEIRNSLAHSSNNELTNARLQSGASKMKTLLQDPVRLESLPACQKAVKAIEDLTNRGYEFTFRLSGGFLGIEKGSTTVLITEKRVVWTLITSVILVTAGLTWWNWGWLTAVIAACL